MRSVLCGIITLMVVGCSSKQFEVLYDCRVQDIPEINSFIELCDRSRSVQLCIEDAKKMFCKKTVITLTIKNSNGQIIQEGGKVVDISTPNGFVSGNVPELTTAPDSVILQCRKQCLDDMGKLSNTQEDIDYCKSLCG
ncbi:MAG: hypothetical protein R3309_01680 [Reinekea sp.]|nr:hypothetical protein [Reinekea sp.]